MERLTYSGTKEAKPNVTIKQITDMLAAYEDTGLTPAEIMELKERDKPRKIELNAGVPTCPVCGRRAVRCYNFCPDCGQRILR